jgi:chemotaxis protein MotB
MADDHPRGNIIIRKKRVANYRHHGGAWKIAFADFMTAMMAFFLTLWIINTTDKETKTVIARYFNPVQIEDPAKSKKGLHGATFGSTEGKEDETDQSRASQAKDGKGAQSSSESKSEIDHGPAKSGAETAEAAAKRAEAQLFAAPYESLDRIASAADKTSPATSPEKGNADLQRAAGAQSTDLFRDSFQQVGPSSPDADEGNHTAPDAEPTKTGKEEKPQEAPPPKPSEKPAPSEAVMRTGSEDAGAEADATRSGRAAARIEKQLRDTVGAALGPGPRPGVEARQTKDGLLISLTDKLDFSMFEVGSSEPRPALVRAMEAVAKLVKDRPGSIIVRGYTDARPYRNGAYDNWRLSSSRAQMAYYMLTRGGAPAERFTRVEGYADRALRDPGHPFAAVNRRLEILIEEPRP